MQVLILLTKSCLWFLQKDEIGFMTSYNVG